MPTLTQFGVKRWLINQKGIGVRSRLRRRLKEKKQKQLKKRNYRRRRARTLLTNNEDDYELEGDIDLPIEEESDLMNEDGSDDNNVGV